MLPISDADTASGILSIRFRQMQHQPDQHQESTRNQTPPRKLPDERK